MITEDMYPKIMCVLLALVCIRVWLPFRVKSEK